MYRKLFRIYNKYVGTGSVHMVLVVNFPDANQYFTLLITGLALTVNEESVNNRT